MYNNYNNYNNLSGPYTSGVNNPMPDFIKSPTKAQPTTAKLIEDLIHRIEVLESGGSEGVIKKVTWGEIVGLVKDQKDLQLILDAIKEDVLLKANKTDLNSINVKLDEKATIVDLDKVKDSIKDFVTTDQLGVVETTLATKASQLSVDNIQQQIDGLASTVDIENLTTEVQSKAEKSDVDILSTEVETIKNTTTTSTALNTVKSELQTQIGGKADNFSVDGTSVTLSEDRVLSAKISNTVDWGGIKGVMTNQSDLQSALNNKANNTDIDSLKIDVSNKAPNFTVDGVTVKLSGDRVLSATGSGTSEWGGITGDLTNQADLNDALNNKVDLSQAALYATKESVELKADKADVNTIKTDVSGLKTDKADNFKVDGITVLMSADRTLSAPGGSPGGSTQWGNIVGDITQQSDLQLSLNSKVSQDGLDSTLVNYAKKTEIDAKADTSYVDGQLAQKAQIIDYDTSTLSLDNKVASSIPMLTVLNKFSRSVLSTTQFIDTTTGATNVLPYNQGIGIHTITENGGGGNPYRLDSFEFSLQAFVHTENANIVNYMIPLKDSIDGVKLTTSSGTPNYWYSGGALSKSNYPNKTRVSLGIAGGRQLSLMLQSGETTPADHNFTVTFTLYIATPL